MELNFFRIIFLNKVFISHENLEHLKRGLRFNSKAIIYKGIDCEWVLFLPGSLTENLLP